MTLSEVLEQVSSYAKENSPAVIFLVGDLGAGKTHFTNQFAKHIGIGRSLPSPTFTFLQDYTCDWEGKTKIIHTDLYRIEPDQAEKVLEQIGFWDYLDEKNILFIEWPERAEKMLTELPHKTVTISIKSDGDREYELS
ncbi:tRNA (adenosine(37)-N6)-threonylcarbamoyltransferase complex ATPase subunit type 1 TsaE [bacterium]|nr:tRNA (adenosine(37)-N6)-threonylcarbamoyltransferase complex ATPase subunit type 1 TsaE [bacterium]